MERLIVYLITLVSLIACGQSTRPSEMVDASELPRINIEGQTISTRINLPEGYSRIDIDSHSFAAYLRNFSLKPDGTEVFYYNGKPKYTQNLHVAVLNIDVGSQDLQQCADAVMRLRGEYLYHSKDYSKIAFNFVSDGKARYFMDYREGDTSYKSFRKYMNYIFSYANTRSLYNELEPVTNIQSMQIGDVFIQTGNPFGHAVIVVDMAENKETGAKIFMIAQSYMPAQDIHILKNLQDREMNPWYRIDNQAKQVNTPEWTFYPVDLRRFKK